MCGIVSVQLDASVSRSEADLDAIRVRMAEGLINTEVRGHHAVGMAIIGPSGHRVFKDGMSATDWLRSGGMEEALLELRADDTAIIGHCRYATHGLPSDNANNHPLRGERVTLVHNGVCLNEQALKRRYGDYAEVDSAAIVASLDANLDGERKGRMERAASAWSELEGGNAGMFAIDGDDRLFAALGGNPLVMTIRRDGAVWYASTEYCLPDSVRPGAVRLRNYSAYAFSQAGLFGRNEYASKTFRSPGQSWARQQRLERQLRRRGEYDPSIYAPPTLRTRPYGYVPDDHFRQATLPEEDEQALAEAALLAEYGYLDNGLSDAFPARDWPPFEGELRE